MIKRKTKLKEGYVSTYAFHFLGKGWIIARSETKWHAGDKYKRMPIWAATVGGDIPTLFIGKLAIGYTNRKQFF